MCRMMLAPNGVLGSRVLEGFLRMALVEPEDRIREACRRVAKLLKGKG